MVFSESDKAVIHACWTEKGWGARKIVKEFPGKRWKVGSVHRLINKIKQTGTTERKAGSGRLRTATTEENKQHVAEMIASQEECPGTHKSQRQIASQLNVSRRSVQRMTKSIGFKAFKRIRVSRRDTNVRAKRKTRCRNLYDRYSNEDVKKIVFTDEKDFTLEIARNRQNDRVYGARKKELPANRLYHESCRFTKKVMVSSGVSWNGKTDIYFMDTKNTKVNSECYMKLLDEGLLPDCRRMYPNEDYVFQQDGATSHTSRATQSYLVGSTPSFIKKDEWPPQSPDCNPMDYSVWASLSEKVYSGRKTVFKEEELKDTIRQKWSEISQDEVRKAILSWKKRLRAVCDQSGGHIDHLFN